MKYRIIKDRQDPNCIEIHVDERLIRGPVLIIDPTDDLGTVKEEISDVAILTENLVSFYEVVIDINGIQPEAIIQRYSLTLNKGILFRWEDLIPQILPALKMLVAKDGKLEEASKHSKARKKGKKAQVRGVIPRK